MATLPTNFKDDILDTSVNTRRRYRMYENTDGTIELEDVTEYSQVGDVFGAGQINSTNTEVNKKFDKNMLVRDLDTINAITKEGYAPDALALKEVNQSLEDFLIVEAFSKTVTAQYVTPVKIPITTPDGYEAVGVIGYSVSYEFPTHSAVYLSSDKTYVSITISGNGKNVTGNCSADVLFRKII